MTEAEWLTSEDPAALFHLVTQNPDHQEITCTRSDYKAQCILDAWNSSLCGDGRWCLGYAGRDDSALINRCLAVVVNITTNYRPVAANLLREIVGNPFRPVRLPREHYRCQRCNGGLHAEWGVPDSCRDCSGKGYREGDCPWLTPTVLSLAQAAYDERPGLKCERCGGYGKIWKAFGGTREDPCRACHGTGRITNGTLDPDRLAILSDALEDAGCEDPVCENCKDADFLTGNLGNALHPALSRHAARQCVCKGTRRSAGILAHLRSPGPHVRGCHFLDLLLGKE